MATAETNSDGSKIWLDGELIAYSDATIHVLANSNQRGSTIFDVLRVLYPPSTGVPAAFGLREHVARFVASMGLMGMEWDGSIGSLESGVAQTVAANPGASVVKLVATWSEVGTASVPTNLKPQIWISALDPAATADGAPKALPLKLKVAEGPKTPDSILPVGMKIAAMYSQGIREIMLARSLGFDDVVFKDLDGRLAESSTKSVVIIKDGQLIVPPLTQVLDGISRRSVLEVARHLQVPVEVRQVEWTEVEQADEVFASSTNTVVVPVTHIDEIEYGVGPVTSKLADAVDQLLAGNHALSTRWLTPLT